MRLTISINEYLTAWEINVDYAKTQLGRAQKKLARCMRQARTEEEATAIRKRGFRIGRALEILETIK